MKKASQLLRLDQKETISTYNIHLDQFIQVMNNKPSNQGSWRILQGLHYQDFKIFLKKSQIALRLKPTTGFEFIFHFGARALQKWQSAV